MVWLIPQNLLKTHYVTCFFIKIVDNFESIPKYSTRFLLG